MKNKWNQNYQKNSYLFWSILALVVSCQKTIGPWDNCLRRWNLRNNAGKN